MRPDECLGDVHRQVDEAAGRLRNLESELARIRGRVPGATPPAAGEDGGALQELHDAALRLQRVVADLEAHVMALGEPL